MRLTPGSGRVAITVIVKWPSLSRPLPSTSTSAERSFQTLSPSSHHHGGTQGRQERAGVPTKAATDLPPNAGLGAMPSLERAVLLEHR